MLWKYLKRTTSKMTIIGESIMNKNICKSNSVMNDIINVADITKVNTYIRSSNESVFHENKKKVSKVCLDCRWLHIGQNVSHNHCGYPYDRSYDDYKEHLVNGRKKSEYCHQKNVPDRFFDKYGFHQ